ncbi:lipopolysaccharide biosynthesis protein [Streptomyces sp. NBC_01803]|uniref:lipopolysaccharide biosynthesis protein n=1 Tax=Streptomyces sp. NBC_01803 TaxID=2975946 RepID=UPI002DDBEE92|nr:lipopolysaccharide biosynthesis protein [Streptomyces sp. NBC_01803]WSA46510.1 lipopolysaccharide biosynthesis protein [Streptomyces sp. NBC_01803]
MSAARDDGRGFVGQGGPGGHSGHPYDEPDLLRDQFRQLLRYRLLIICGILVGLAGGGWLGLSANETYIANSEITVRIPTASLLAEPSAIDRVVMGSERRTAVSNLIAQGAAEHLGLPADRARGLRSGLQVTNPPNTEVLRFSYSADDPRVAADRADAFVRSYLANRQADAEESIQRTIESYEQQRDPLLERRAELEDRLAVSVEGTTGYDRTIADLSGVNDEISGINTEIATLQSVDTSGGRVITEAVPPGSPSGPGLPLLLGLGYVVGIGIGLLAAWVRLVFDPTVRSAGDVTRALRAPVLGVLPRTGRGHPDQLLAEGRLAEEYRSVAFRLAYDETFAQRRRLLVVAPRGSIETPLAASVNLTAAFAEMGMDALLVEADLRTPTLTDQLRHADGVRPGWASSPGREDGGWPAGLRVPIDAGESGIFDLVPGRRVRNVPRALTSPAATQLIGHADTKGSVVVVLAPAVLSYADAIALIDRVDGVVVVCDPSQVRRDDLARVRELVVGAGGILLGAVLHSWGSGSDYERREPEDAVPNTATTGTGTGTARAAAPPRPRAAVDERIRYRDAPARDRERDRERRVPRPPDPDLRDIGSETLGLRILDPSDLEDGSPRQ